MIDKKQLINELLECVQDATDLETKITGLTMCATLFESVLEEAINYTPCCKSDSEQLRSSCEWCNGNNRPIDGGTSYDDLGK